MPSATTPTLVGDKPVRIRSSINSHYPSRNGLRPAFYNPSHVTPNIATLGTRARRTNAGGARFRSAYFLESWTNQQNPPRGGEGEDSMRCVCLQYRSFSNRVGVDNKISRYRSTASTPRWQSHVVGHCAPMKGDRKGKYRYKEYDSPPTSLPLSSASSLSPFFTTNPSYA